MDKAWKTIFLISLIATEIRADVSEKILNLSLQELLEVKVSAATLRPQLFREIPATIYIMTEDDFSRYGFRNLKDALKFMPGVEYGDAHSWLQGGQRGFANTWSQTKLLINGREANQNLLQDSAYMANQYPLNAVKQVELIQVPSSAIHGADAFSGVINIVTKSGVNSETENSVGFSTWHGQKNVEGTQIALSSIGQASDRLKYSFHLSHADFSDPDFTDFVVTNEFSEQNVDLRRQFIQAGFPYRDENIGENLSLDLNFQQNAETAWMAGFDVRKSNDGGGIENPELIFTNFKDSQDQSRVYANWKKDILEGRGRFSFDYHHIQESLQFDFNLRDTVNGEVPPFVTFKQSKNKKSDTVLQFDYDSARLNNYLVMGLQYRTIDLTSPEFPLDNFDAIMSLLSRNEKAFFIQLQQYFLQRQVEFTFGYRYDDNSLFGANDNVRSAFQYRIDNSSTIKFHFGQAFREPTIFQLSTNSALKSATNNSYELSYDKELSENYWMHLSVYRIKSKDIIQEDRAANDGISRNIGRADINGWEAYWRWQQNNWQGFFWLNYVDESSKLDVADKKMGMGISYETDSKHTLSVKIKYTSDIDTEYLTSVNSREIFNVDAYRTLDFIYRTPIYHLSRSTDLQLSVTSENLFDWKNFYPNVRGPDPIQFLDQGRNVALNLELFF